ncbi:hypothetical protein FOL47_004919 [Perkinsus chesapeaki]|uniref:Uncharacterized protein n=1 Tax=Perkinsus chesapeaki TaxID=330153 RepID=A0A7J6LZX3_PERCH|nr:hypothetical protein FOL47_004919 [Perkinsus chesapeaki]
MTHLESENAPSPTVALQRSNAIHSSNAGNDASTRSDQVSAVSNHEARGATTISNNSLQFIKNVSSRITRNAMRYARRRLWTTVNELAGLENYRDRQIRIRDESMRRSQKTVIEGFQSKLEELRKVAMELERELNEADRESTREGVAEQVATSPKGILSFVSGGDKNVGCEERLREAGEATRMVRRETRPLRRRLRKIVEDIVTDEPSMESSLSRVLDGDDDSALLSAVESICRSLGEGISASKRSHRDEMDKLTAELAEKEAQAVETQRELRKLDKLQVSEMQRIADEKRILVPDEVNILAPTALPPLDSYSRRIRNERQKVGHSSPYLTYSEDAGEATGGSPRKVRRREESKNLSPENEGS